MYKFWSEERGEAHTLGDPQPMPTEREYYEGIRRLARELAKKLQDLARPTATTPGPPVTGSTVFVSGGEQDIDLMRDMAARLQERGCGSILPDAHLTSAKAIRQALCDNLEICDAFLLVYRHGPSTQVRQYIKEYRKHKTRSEAVPQHVHLCQDQSTAEDLGINIPELHVICTGEACVDECVERFLQERAS